MADQLIKKTGAGNQLVFPKTYTDNIYDYESKRKLSDMLGLFNSYLVTYDRNPVLTRNQISIKDRKIGLFLIYVQPNGKIAAEVFKGPDTKLSSWENPTNWQIIYDSDSNINNKVDKVAGKDLVADNLITKLLELYTQDTLENKFSSIDVSIAGIMDMLKAIQQGSSLKPGGDIIIGSPENSELANRITAIEAILNNWDSDNNGYVDMADNSSKLSGKTLAEVQVGAEIADNDDIQNLFDNNNN